MKLATFAACGGFVLYLLVLRYLGELNRALDPLNAVGGLLVAFFTLVLLLIERERDHREEAREHQTRERIDQKVSALSLLVSRQFASWLEEIGSHDGVNGDLESALNVLGEIDRDDYRRILQPVLEWWASKKRDQDESERRLEELVTDVPEASPRVATAIRHSFVKFNDFAGRWNWAVRTMGGGATPGWRDVVTGYKSLQSATAALEIAIDTELRAIRDEKTPLSEPIKELAAALQKTFDETE